MRDAYVDKFERTNLNNKGDPLAMGMINGEFCYTYWFGDRCIRLADIPGTLSGDILRLKRNLPSSVDHGDHEIIGDEIRPLVNAPPPKREDSDSEYESDPENGSELESTLASLPVIEVDPSKHHVKQGKYRSEIRNLLKCQGGSCPGTPSPHITPLLGKTRDGKLVFEKFVNRVFVLGHIHCLADYKNWILQIISGMKTLHSLGIVHRALHINNLLFSAASDRARVLIGGLESHYGNPLAPEIREKRGESLLDAPWSEKSDIYDLGHLIKCMVYGNVPLTLEVEWPVPSPLDAIVEACTRYKPEERASLDDLYAAVENIQIEYRRNPSIVGSD